MKIKYSTFASLLFFAAAGALIASGPPRELAAASRFVAIDNVCAWPMLTKLDDGTIIVVIHNQPSHGQQEGQIECWASKDGEFWQKRGYPAPNAPNTVRMNAAVGRGRNGDLLVLCSGWTNVRQPPQRKMQPFRDGILPVWICRSSDGGVTWTHTEQFPSSDPGLTPYIPFGPILVGENGALHVSCYTGRPEAQGDKYVIKGWNSSHLRSDDDGRTWRKTSTIGSRHNETALFHLGGKNWLAAARSDAVDLFRSEDDGDSWGEPLRVSRPNEIPAHIMRLRDGRLLLSYGVRVPGEHGVFAKVSADEGRTWSEPHRISRREEHDGGYPSSIQRGDGKVVTVYYSKRVLNHDRYHMGVTIWDANELQAGSR